MSAVERAALEVVVPLPCPREKLALPKHVRSTLLASSQRALRARGLFDAYAAQLDPQWKEAVLETVAGVWLPTAAALAHYRACDALSLSMAEIAGMGREVGDRINGTFLGTMVRAAKSAGVTPWVVFPYTPKLYDRLFDGGGCWVEMLGPKDARMELVANPMAGIPYFRHAMRGVWQAAIELFCRKAYIVEAGRTDTSYKVKISWV